MVELVLPVGFGLVAARLLWHAASHWRGRAAAALLAGSIIWFGIQSPVAPGKMVLPALLALLLATVLGAPVFTTLGGAALILFWGDQSPIAAIAVKHYSMTTNPSLPTIPLFTLAGYFLAESGASRRLVSVFQAWFGSIRGGPAIVTALVCAFFTSFTGASGVTILALAGGLGSQVGSRPRRRRGRGPVARVRHGGRGRGGPRGLRAADGHRDPSRPASVQRPASSHDGVRAVGRRGPDDSGCRARFYPLPGGRADSGQNGRMVHPGDPVAVAVPARAERCPAFRRRADRNLRG